MTCTSIRIKIDRQEKIAAVAQQILVSRPDYIALVNLLVAI